MQCPECHQYYNECFGHKCRVVIKSVADLVEDGGFGRIEYGADGLASRVVWTPPTCPRCGEDEAELIDGLCVECYAKDQRPE